MPAMLTATPCQSKASTRSFIRPTQVHRLTTRLSPASEHGNHKRHDSSEGRGSQVSAHALRDPNWRTRRSDEYVFVVSPRCDSLETAAMVGSKSHETDPLEICIDSYDCQGMGENKYPSNLSYSESESVPLSVSRSANPDRRWLSDCPNDEYEIVKQTRVCDNPTIELFELSADPAVSKIFRGCTLTRLIHGSDSESSRGTQRSLSTRAATQTSDESQDEQLMAALSATNSTPPKVRGLATGEKHEPKNYKEGLKPLKELGISQKALHSGSNYGIAPKATKMATTISAPSGPVPPVKCVRRPDFKQKDDAFAKMLQKLQSRRVHDEVKSEQLPDNKHHHATQVVSLQPPEPQQVIDHRKPTHGSGRRVKTASDYDINYRNQTRTSHESESPTDPDVRNRLQNGKYNMLNPKAREFLSMPRGFGDPEKLSGTPASSGSNVGSLYPSILHTRRPTPQPQIGSLPSLVPVDSTASFPPLGTADSIVRLLELVDIRACAMGLIPVTSKHFAGLQHPPCLPTCAPLPSQTGTRVSHQGKCPSSNLNLIPDLNSLPVDLSQPLASPVIPVQSAPTSGRPHPVPKPKHPDPKEQQAYEQWVEFRKANEPGYAMACKLRQQRRAQRSNPQKDKRGQKRTSDEQK